MADRQRNPRQPTSPIGQSVLRVPQAEAETQLAQQIAVGGELVNAWPVSPSVLEHKIGQWTDFNRTWLDKYLGGEAAEEYRTVSTRSFGYGHDSSRKVPLMHAQVEREISKLQSIQDRLQMWTPEPDLTPSGPANQVSPDAISPDTRINRREITRMMGEIQREFDKHPIRVPVQVNSPMPPDGRTGGNTLIFNGPVIQGSADGAQLAWGNYSVHQSRKEQIAPGFEAITQAVVKTLEQLPYAGLADNEQQEAEAAANEVLTEVTQPKPDQGKIRRALATLKGFIAPVAMGIVSGAAEGAQGWARTAIEQLGKPF